MQTSRIQDDLPRHERRNALVVAYLRRLGYENFRLETDVEAGALRFEVDLVAYSDSALTTPVLLAEVKSSLGAEIGILSPAVQRAFAAAAALGDEIRYLLISDGETHHWFARNAEAQSLTKLESAPSAIDYVGSPELAARLGLLPVTHQEAYLRLVNELVRVVRADTFDTTLSAALSINRLLVAKLDDEYRAADGAVLAFQERHRSSTAVHDVRVDVERIYLRAMQRAGYDALTGEWRLSDDAAYRAVSLLQYYQLSAVPPTLRARAFWRFALGTVRDTTARHLTPPAISQLLVRLARPRAGERALDPACGSALLLLDAVDAARGNSPPDAVSNSSGLRIVGIERSKEAAELAATNLVISDEAHSTIVLRDALRAGIPRHRDEDNGQFDVVLVDPPTGYYARDDARELEWSELARLGRTPLEALFIEYGLKRLRPGGRLAVVVPDSLLSSSAGLAFRRWLLRNARLRVIVSLPAEAFAPVGYGGKSSALLVERPVPGAEKSDRVLMCQVKSLGYDRFGAATAESDLAAISAVVDGFLARDTDPASGAGDDRLAYISSDELSAERLDVGYVSARRGRSVESLTLGAYPTVPLGRLVEIISGRNAKVYVEGRDAVARVVQAGAVREFYIDPIGMPLIDEAQFRSALRSAIQPRDVLVTTTGILGRAAVVENNPAPAIASGAVTILRARSDINVDYLAAVLNSSVGRDQINQLQAAALAQPYIRRADLGRVLVPVPPSDVQETIGQRTRALREQADTHRRRAELLDEEARDLVRDLLEIPGDA